MLKVAAGAAALLALGAGTANAAVTAPAKAVTWKSGLSKVVGVTTAVTGVKVNAAITEFAFVEPGDIGSEDSKPVLYTRVNSGGWHAQAIPGTVQGEAITAATAITANHVVALARLTRNNQVTNSVVLSYYEGKWSTVEKFSGTDDITVLSATDIWAFGAAGTSHYNGETWQKITGSVTSGAGVSATRAWAYTEKSWKRVADDGARTRRLLHRLVAGTSLRQGLEQARAGAGAWRDQRDRQPRRRREHPRYHGGDPRRRDTDVVGIGHQLRHALHD